MSINYVSGALVFYILMLVAGFISDALFPAFEVEKGSVIFHGSLTIGLTLANLSLLFLVIIVLIVLVSVSHKREALLSNELLWRRLFVASIFILMFVGSFLGSVYVLSKRIVINDDNIQYSSLIEKKEVQWSEIEMVNGNFVPGSRLGLRGRSNYAWVDFTTIKGETIHFSLRFMRGTSLLEKIIMQEIDKL